MTFASYDFSGSGELNSANADFVKVTGYPINAIITGANRLRSDNAVGAVYRHVAAPPSADYEVTSDVYVFDSTTGISAGVIARCSDSAGTFYYGRWRPGVGHQLFRVIAGTATQIGSTVATTYSNGTNASLALRVEGSTISLFKDGETTAIISVSDANITAAGFAGVYIANASFTSGPHLDNWAAAALGGTPIAFTGTVPTLSGTEGAAFSEPLSSYFSGTETPFAYTVQAGTLPAGLTLNSSTGVISGTPTTAGTSSGIVVRGTDATPDTADTNSFSIVIAAGGGGDVTAPTVPGVATFASVTKNSYTANWTASTDAVGVTGYEYRINGGTAVDVGNVLTVNITGRTPGATDTFEVRAYDAAGNRSAYSTATVILPLYGFAFSTAVGLDFGAIVGTLTGIARETAGASWTVFVHNDTTRALILTSTAQTIDSSGRLPDYTSATLDSGTYFVSFRRSDGAFASARLTTENLA